MNTDDPIGVQLHAIQRELSRHARDHGTDRVTQAHLAAQFDVATETVRRALGKVDVDRCAPGPVSVAIARHLGVRAEYVALALTRDDVRRQWMGLRSSKTRLIEQYQAIEQELEQALASISPYAADRLPAVALRATRVAHGAADKLPYRQLERGELVLERAELSEWADEIAPHAAEHLTPLMNRLAVLHGVSQGGGGRDARGAPTGHTLERVADFPPRGAQPHEAVWRSRSPKQPELRWYCPPGAGTIALDVSPTTLAGLSVEVLTAHVAGASQQPPSNARSRVRCVGARHPGRELAVVTHGAVLFSMSRHPFPEEDAAATPDVTGDCIDSRVFGAGDIAILDSGLYHRCEFLGAFTRVVSFNIEASVCIATAD